MRRQLKDIFENKSWAQGGRNPVSGAGSSMAATKNLREALGAVFENYKVKTFIDAPCGDWHWMQHVDLSSVEYLGCDISEKLITQNTKSHARAGVQFKVLDITSDELPSCDLFMCRDCLFHLRFRLRWQFLERFLASGSKYLLTTINQTDLNRDLRRNGSWKPFNPLMPPFNFPAPLELIAETDDQLSVEQLCASYSAGKHRALGIWSREQIAEVAANRAVE